MVLKSNIKMKRRPKLKIIGLVCIMLGMGLVTILALHHRGENSDFYLVRYGLSDGARRVRDFLNITTEEDLRRFLNRLGLDIMDLEGELTRARMNQYLEEEVNREALVKNAREIYFNEIYYKTITHWLAKTEDPILKRRLTILKRWFDFQKISLDPQVSQLEKQLMEKDPQRDIESGFKKLVKLRNQKARELGYKDWVDLKFQLNEIDEKWLQEIFARLKEATDEPMRILAEREKERLGKDDIHVSELWFFEIMRKYWKKVPMQKQIEGVTKMLASIGIDISDLPIVLKWVKDLPFVGYDFLIKPGLKGESILLLRKGGKGRYWTTALHELGHAVSDAFISSGLPLELQRWEGINSTFSEGLADMIGLLSFHPDWLNAYTDLSSKEIDELYQAFLWDQIFYIRWNLARSEFEYELYRNPDQDLDKLWETIQSRYNCGTILFLPWKRYTSFLFSSEDSVYFQNYILSRLIYSQVQPWVKKKFGSLFNNSEIGKFLREKLYAPGISRPWREIIREATGKDLDAEAFINEVIRNLIP